MTNDEVEWVVWGESDKFKSYPKHIKLTFISVAKVFFNFSLPSSTASSLSSSALFLRKNSRWKTFSSFTSWKLFCSHLWCFKRDNIQQFLSFFSVRCYSENNKITKCEPSHTTSHPYISLQMKPTKREEIVDEHIETKFIIKFLF